MISYQYLLSIARSELFVTTELTRCCALVGVLRHMRGLAVGVPLLRRSSEERNPLPRHCLFQAVAHCGEKCGPEAALLASAAVGGALVGPGAIGAQRQPRRGGVEPLDDQVANHPHECG